MHITQNQNN